VTSVLEGTVRKEGGRVRIGAQLIDAKSEKHLWAETHDRDYDHLFIAQFYGLLGDREKALAQYRTSIGLLRKIIEEQPENAFHYSSLGLAHAGIGEKNEAVQWAKEAVEVHRVRTDPWSSGEDILLDLAHVYIMIGEPDQALARLEFLLSGPSKLTLCRLKLDPIYDPLRNYPRFRRLVSGG
jgi:tetratricopeptide (TPR) repeat protein